MPRRACIIAVGSEMLTPFRVDTNSLFITDRLNTIGFDVRIKTVVGDDIGELAGLVHTSLTWADVIVLTGGLGPTADDITREAVARVLGLPFDEDEETVARIRERFTRRGMVMQEINRRQAMVPRGAALLDNPNGTAPGLWLEHGKTALVLLPGPPREMKPMFEAVVRDRLAPRSGGAGLVPPRAENHRPAGVGGRREDAADLRPLADAGGADQHDDSGGPRPDRTAPDRDAPGLAKPRIGCSTPPFASSRRCWAATCTAWTARRSRKWWARACAIAG